MHVLAIAGGRERLMVVSVEAELAAGLQELAAVDDDVVTRRASGKLVERAMNLRPVRLDHHARVLQVIALRWASIHGHHALR